MKSATPIFRLRRDARRLSRSQSIPLHAALDRIAAQEGYARWSLLVENAGHASPAARFYEQLAEGDLVLVAARPRQGKTLFAMELAARAMGNGRRCTLFTLEDNEQDVLARFEKIGIANGTLDRLFTLDTSDDIGAAHIETQTASTQRGTVVIVDYLQLLDQRRDKPTLEAQLRDLKRIAVARGLTVIVLSQVDRAFETSGRALPNLGDIRLPNPADLSLFDRMTFLNRGEIGFDTCG